MEKSKIFGVIYKSTNVLTKEIYIGKTTENFESYKERVHINRSKKHGELRYFHFALNTYGEEKFKWDILCELYDENLLNLAERYFIIYYRSDIKGFGYNSKLPYLTNSNINFNRNRERESYYTKNRIGYENKLKINKEFEKNPFYFKDEQIEFVVKLCIHKIELNHIVELFNDRYCLFNERDKVNKNQIHFIKKNHYEINL